jgi:hypothetical protein
MEEEMSDYEKAMLEGMVGELEDQGVFEWVGMDESGDRILKPNMEKMLEVAPEMYVMMLGEVSEMLEHLYKLGLVEVEYSEDLEPGFRISNEGRAYLRAHGIEIGDTEE